MTTDPSILLVEDNDDDVFLMRRALKAAGIANPVQLVEDGQQALDYFRAKTQGQEGEESQLPAIVFLDLKLPVLTGLEVLDWIRNQPFAQNIAVVVLTSSNEPSDLKEAYRLGANSYLVKPPTAEQLQDLAKAFKWNWLSSRNSEEPG
jgi:CheY-like chemotaxis protein